MNETTWVAIGSISAAIAAIASLATISIALCQQKIKSEEDKSRSKSAILAKLVLLDRALDKALRRPNSGAMGSIKSCLYELLDTIGKVGGTDSEHNELITLIEKTYIFIDELDFNSLNEKVVKDYLNEQELKFRVHKNSINKELFDVRSKS